MYLFVLMLLPELTDDAAVKFGFIGTLVVVCLITGFAVMAVGWTIRRS